MGFNSGFKGLNRYPPIRNSKKYHPSYFLLEFLYCGPWVMRGGLWGWASLFTGALLGNLEWARLLGTFRDGRKGLCRWGVSLYESSVKGTWREGSLAGYPG